MEFYHYFLSVTFVVLTAYQQVGAVIARLNNRSRIATFHISSDLKEKSESSLERRRSLRN